MDIKQYGVIPAWVFQRCADWQKLISPTPTDRAYLETRGFFEYKQNIQVYIVEEPTNAIDNWNQELIPELEKIAAEFGARIITWETDEAKEFYLTQARIKAGEFTVATNPFNALVLNHDRTRCDLVSQQ